MQVKIQFPKANRSAESIWLFYIANRAGLEGESMDAKTLLPRLATLAHVLNGKVMVVKRRHALQDSL